MVLFEAPSPTAVAVPAAHFPSRTVVVVVGGGGVGSLGAIAGVAASVGVSGA